MYYQSTTATGSNHSSEIFLCLSLNERNMNITQIKLNAFKLCCLACKLYLESFLVILFRSVFTFQTQWIGWERVKLVMHIWFIFVIRNKKKSWYTKLHISYDIVVSKYNIVNEVQFRYSMTTILVCKNFCRLCLWGSWKVTIWGIVVPPPSWCFLQLLWCFRVI